MDRRLLGRTGSFAAVAALQQSSLYLGKLMIQSAVNGISLISTAPISAFAAATRVENFIQAFGISGCEATSIFIAQNRGAGEEKRVLAGFARSAVMLIGMGLAFSFLLRFGGTLLATPFLEPGTDALPYAASYLRLMGLFYFLSFTGHLFVAWFRGTGRMNITFWGTTLQIAIRVAGAYLLISAMGLDAVALSTGLGWVAIVLFQVTVFLLEKRGIWPRQNP